MATLVQDLQAVKLDLSRVVIIDLSLCSLRDIDTALIRNLLSACKNCRVLTLRDNQFYGLREPYRQLFDPHIMQMLDSTLEFLDLAGNAAVTSRLDLLQTLSKVPARLQKLIWLKKEWHLTAGSPRYQRLSTLLSSRSTRRTMSASNFGGFHFLTELKQVCHLLIATACFSVHKFNKNT
jgi:hypothetical protein